MQKIVGIGVFREGGGHGTNDGHIVDVTGHFRKQIADRYAALTVVFELPRAGERVTDVVELSGFDPAGEWFAVHSFEGWFRVERVDLRDAAIHVQKDDTERFWGEVGRFDAGGLLVAGWKWRCGFVSRQCAGEQVTGSDGAKSTGGR